MDARGIADVYIDDTIVRTVDVENSNNVKRLKEATIMAIHCAARDYHVNEPIPRDSMAAREKLIAEAGADEVKTILGWICNFRTLSVALPEKTILAWRKSILDVLESGCTYLKEQERLIVRSLHLGIPLHPIHHFLFCS